MSRTLFEKIWDRHVVKTISEDTQVIYIDQHFLHEVTSPQAFDGLRKRGIGVFRTERCLATVDHNVPTINQDQPIQDPVSAHQVETLRKNCSEFGIQLYDMGDRNQGIVHVIGPELGKTLPGSTIVCGDSHTSTHGAFGTIAFGIGTSQVEQVLATQCLVLDRPKTMKIELEGDLAQGSSAKDVILHIISHLGAEGGTGYFVEYCGKAIEAFSMEERMTICNMSIEMGARGGLIGVDKITLDYLKERTDLYKEKADEWAQLKSDADASFDKTIRINAANIVPMVTMGTSPDTGFGFDQNIGALSRQALEYMGLEEGQGVADLTIDHVFIGSCTNGRIEDLRAVGEMVKGKTKADNVVVWVVPGSVKVREQAIAEGLDKVFMDAGFEFREPGCSACLAMNDDKIPEGAYCVSTSNRNFEGRQGKGARTILASPQSAAAAALTGKLTDPRTIAIEA